MRPQAEAGLEKLQHCTSRQVDRRKVRCWVLGGLRGCRTVGPTSEAQGESLRRRRGRATWTRLRGGGRRGDEVRGKGGGFHREGLHMGTLPGTEQTERPGPKSASAAPEEVHVGDPFSMTSEPGKRCDAIVLRPHLPMPSCRSGESLVVATGTDRTLSSLSLYWDHAVQRPHSQRASPSPGNICLGKLVVQPRHATPPGQIPSFEI
ncbi:unnamed protein product [Diplocarpon coronariae]